MSDNFVITWELNDISELDILGIKEGVKHLELSNRLVIKKIFSSLAKDMIAYDVKGTLTMYYKRTKLYHVEVR